MRITTVLAVVGTGVLGLVACSPRSPSRAQADSAQAVRTYVDRGNDRRWELRGDGSYTGPGSAETGLYFRRGDTLFFVRADHGWMRVRGDTLESETGERAVLRQGPPSPEELAAEAERPYLATMKSDLRNLVTAEEGHFADNLTYTARPEAFVASAGVTVTIQNAGRTGWSAVARHQQSSTTCRIYVGSATVPGLNEGEPKCER